MDSNEKKQPHIISIEELRNNNKKKSQGEIVELPSGMIVKLRRPSLSVMLMEGLIPDELINVALNMQASQVSEIKNIKKNMQVVSLIIKKAFVEPADITDEDIIELDDDDKGFIMNYVQKGAKDLVPFRKQLPIEEIGSHSETVSE